jgi:hypothetical protein
MSKTLRRLFFAFTGIWDKIDQHIRCNVVIQHLKLSHFHIFAPSARISVPRSHKDHPRQNRTYPARSVSWVGCSIAGKDSWSIGIIEYQQPSPPDSTVVDYEFPGPVRCCRFSVPD